MSMKTRGGSGISSPDEKSVKLIAGCTILTPLRRIENGVIIINGGRVSSLGATRLLPIPVEAERHSFKGCFAVPGFIDIHLHGALGINFTNAGPDLVIRALGAHLENGTTACLPTVMTSTEQRILNAMKAIMEVKESGQRLPEILGINLEGPFISPEKRGVHEIESIRSPSLQEMIRYIEASRQLIRIVTVAPERPGAIEFIRNLAARGIIVSAGHTNASYEEMMSVIPSGIKLATHLFNAMKGILQREPGAAGALLLSDEVYAEIISDGEHIHPALLRLIARTKGIEGIILVTDASPDYGKKTTAMRTGSGTLAGSNMPLPGALKIFLKHSRLGLQTGLRAITCNPALLLGISHRIGSIRKGADADIVILDSSLDVKALFLKGERLF